MTASTESMRSLEEIAAAAAGPLWFQLYVYRARYLAEQLIQRAEAAGYKAIVLTVDLPCLGNRERCPALDWQRLHAVEGNFPEELSEEEQEDEALTWEDVEWVRALTSLPVLLKGLLTPEDAVLAVPPSLPPSLHNFSSARNARSVLSGFERDFQRNSAFRHIVLYQPRGVLLVP